MDWKIYLFAFKSTISLTSDTLNQFLYDNANEFNKAFDAYFG